MMFSTHKQKLHSSPFWV